MPPTSLTNGFTYGQSASFRGLESITPVIEGVTLSWSAASGTDPLTYGVYEATIAEGRLIRC